MNMVDSRHSIKVDPFERADAVLSVSDLRAGYGTVPVLHGVNLHIREGEAVGIVGHNGMGKTTFLKVVMGLMPATGGRIELDGMDATGTAAHVRSQMGIGYVPQGRGILPGLTAYENLRMAWREDIGETEEQAVERVVDQFPRLRVLLDRKGGSLSGGEQQILALARALVAKPWLLLLDEPMAGMNVEEKQDMCRFILDVNDEFGTTVVLIEHDMGVVMDISDRVVVLDYGKKIGDGTPDEVRNNPEVISAYLGTGH